MIKLNLQELTTISGGKVELLQNINTGLLYRCEYEPGDFWGIKMTFQTNIPGFGYVDGPTITTNMGDISANYRKA